MRASISFSGRHRAGGARRLLLVGGSLVNDVTVELARAIAADSESALAFGRLVHVYQVLDVPLLYGLHAGVSADAGDDGKPARPETRRARYIPAPRCRARPSGRSDIGDGVGSKSSRSAHFLLGRP
jgi:hypothetical protein